MKPISESLALLLAYNQALTIERTDDGFFITLSDREEGEDERPIFVPAYVLISSATLGEALESFHTKHRMMMMDRFHA